MSNRPLWQRKIVISDKRNISIVLWPGWEHQEGKIGDPNIALTESRNKGSRKRPSWENISIYLTLDKVPRVIADLQVAYAKALAVETVPQGSTDHRAPIPTPEKPKPKLTGLIFEAVSRERRLSAEVDTLASRFNSTAEAVTQALKALQKKGLVKVELDGIEPFLVPA